MISALDDVHDLKSNSNKIISILSLSCIINRISWQGLPMSWEGSVTYYFWLQLLMTIVMYLDSQRNVVSNQHFFALRQRKKTSRIFFWNLKSLIHLFRMKILPSQYNFFLQKSPYYLFQSAKKISLAFKRNLRFDSTPILS